MRLTSSFAVFRFAPGEQTLAKARWLAREGRVDAAEAEYRAALNTNPQLGAGWHELFELLRRCRRLDDALALARDAAFHFGPDAAMPLALEGAALTDMGRLRDATRALEGALERDGNLALAWHETAWAAYRAEQYGRALLALDRAFALEPHTDSLMLRGRILRATGQYDAAVVAFEGAHQSAEHDVPQVDAAREIAATHRAASLGSGRRPADFTMRERRFADDGTLVLEPAAALPGAPALAATLTTLRSLWAIFGGAPAAVAAVSPGDEPLADVLAQRFGAHRVSPAALDPADRPLLVTACNDGAPTWRKQMARLTRWPGSIAFALVQPEDAVEPSDVAGCIVPALPDDAAALLADVLGIAAADRGMDPEVAALARNPAAPWQQRRRDGAAP